jgi:hypothetical protein
MVLSHDLSLAFQRFLSEPIERLFGNAALLLVDTINGFGILVRNVHDLSGIDNLHVLVLNKVYEHVPFLIADDPISP